MTRGIQRRQKPVWKKVRRPMAPPVKVHPSKKKDREWKVSWKEEE